MHCDNGLGGFGSATSTMPTGGHADSLDLHGLLVALGAVTGPPDSLLVVTAMTTCADVPEGALPQIIFLPSLLGYRQEPVTFPGVWSVHDSFPQTRASGPHSRETHVAG